MSIPSRKRAIPLRVLPRTRRPSEQTDLNFPTTCSYVEAATKGISFTCTNCSLPAVDGPAGTTATINGTGNEVH